MMLVTARKPSRKPTFVVDWMGMYPLLSTPAEIMVRTVATNTLRKAVLC